MKIGIEAQRLFREKKHGMDFVALELIKALQRIDTVNQYFIFVNEGPDRCLQETPNCKVIEFPGWYPVWEQYKLPRKCEELGIEVLHCTSNLAPIFTNIPLVVTVHDIIYLEGVMLLKKGFTPYQRFGNMYRKLVAPRILKTAKKIITVSYSERKRLVALPGVPLEKVEVVYNAVGYHFTQAVTEEARRVIRNRYGLPEKFAMFLGNTDPKKNSPNTILAFLKFWEEHKPGLKLVVADLNDIQIDKILKDKGKYHLRDQIITPGYINNQDMPIVVNLAFMFLYTSKRESFGIPILESMSQGVPVVTSCAYSMPEVSGDSAELVDPESIDSIADGISRIYEDSELRDLLINRGYDRVQEFSWERSAKTVLDIYLNQTREKEWQA